MEIFVGIALAIMLGVIIKLSLIINKKNESISNLEYEKSRQTEITNDCKRQIDALVIQNNSLGKQILQKEEQHNKELKDWQFTYNELKDKFDKLVNPTAKVTVNEVTLPKKATSSKSRKKKVSESNS